MKVRKMIKRYFWILIAILGVVGGIILVKQIQRFGNNAFTGYSSNIGNVATANPITYASPSDIPQNTALISSTTSQGLFYTYAARFQNSSPEFEKIAIPSINVTGSIYYLYIPSLDTNYFFARLINIPPIANKLLQVYLESSFQKEYFHIATSQFVLENNIPVAYDVFVGKGNLKSEGFQFIWSYDNAADTNMATPEAAILSVKF